MTAATYAADSLRCLNFAEFAQLEENSSFPVMMLKVIKVNEALTEDNVGDLFEGGAVTVTTLTGKHTESEETVDEE